MSFFNKLHNKRNWIAEFNIWKNSLPKTWIQIIRSYNSVRTQVKIDHSPFYDVFSNLSNKQMYEYFVKRKFDIPYIHKYWSRIFNRQIHWEHVYFFIQEPLLDNTVKQLRFKLIHRIITNNENLFKWKIFGNPLCDHCSEV